ncbi:MAG: DUF58 domain-containing protein [Halobacteriaceae archaeon]
MTLTPAFLEELDRFDPRLHRRTTARRRGEQDAPAVGEGLTYSDHRRYAPGDDTRRIDWRLYARTEEFYVTQYEEERSLTVHVLVDDSASMGFGDPSKFETAARLGLGYAYMTARAHGRFQLSTLGPPPERLDGDRSNRGEVLLLVERLNDVTPDGAGDLAASLEQYAARIHSRSLVVVLSDFLADPEAVADGLLALADNHLVLGHVVAHEERDLPGQGDTRFRGVESDEEFRTWVSPRSRRRYQERLSAHVDAVADRARQVGAFHSRVDTDEEFFDAFARLWTP